MNRIILTTENFEASMASKSAGYFVIHDEIVVSASRTVVPAGSVLDFQGGRLTSSSSVSINLNGATVNAIGYCIFGKNIGVTGFSNSPVRSEWFKDAGEAEHTAINKAIVAANGVPVTLEARTYNLTGSITFPSFGQALTTQTLISPGVLCVSSDIPAITVGCKYVNLHINAIRGAKASTSLPAGKYIGTGIALSGDNYQLRIDVTELSSLHKGFDITSHTKGVQYCKFNFQSIEADYGYYIDLYATDDTQSHGWFNECLITGGRMSGGNGFYMVGKSGGAKMDGLVVRNISFESLSGVALRIRNLKYSKFYDLTFGKNLASGTYADFDEADGLEFVFNGMINPANIKSTATATRVVMRGQIGDASTGVTMNNLDTLLLQPIGGTAQKVATSSRQPFDMGLTVTCDAPANDGIYTVKTMTIKDLIPTPEFTGTSSGDIVSVLPSTLCAVVDEDNELVLDLKGLKAFAPCLFDVYGVIDQGGRLTFTTSDGSIIFKSFEYSSQSGRSLTFNGVGLYRLSWDADYNIVIALLLF